MNKLLHSISAFALILLVFLVVGRTLVKAERLESGSYVIQFGNFNITAGEKSSSSYNVTDTVGQTGTGPYGQYGVSGYFVGSGFQYIYQIDQFRFRISKTLISLGTMFPGFHYTDSHTIHVTTRGAGGYKVYVFEEHPLKHESDVYTVPDTTCDAGTCTHIVAGTWIDQDIPGFGFNAFGDDVAADFSSTSQYRSFANAAASQPMQIIMSSTTSGTNRTATITYKAGVSGDQAAGNYSTPVVYVAVPGY